MLNRGVLVLNKHWLAVHICNVRRSLVLLYQDLARVVTEEYELHSFESWRDISRFARDGVIRTPSFQLIIPEVIMLTRFAKCPPRQVKFNRRNIYLRDNYACQYCGRTPSRDDLTIDHLVPRSRGGRSVWQNVVLACTDCNARKGNHLLSECALNLLRRPKKPHWTACVRVSDYESHRPMWQKFIDNVYWNVPLKE